MNILVVYPKPDQYKKPRFGFSYEMMLIVTILAKHHKVYIKDFSCENYDENELVKYIQSKDIRLSLVECDSYALKRSQNIIHAREIIDVLNRYTTTVAYGNYCYLTHKAFGHSNHTVIRNNINDLIDCVNQCEGNNSTIADLRTYDDFPYIQRDMLWQISYYFHNKKNTLLQTAKGCENTCVFCQRKGWQQCYVMHSDEYVLGELREIRKSGYKNIWIIDENFTFNLPRAKRLLQKIMQAKLHENLNFFISSWANIDLEFLDLAKRCNIKIISFGIESGNKEILRFYRKNINIDHVPNLVQYANSIGIFTVGNFIIGAPMETEETIQRTFDLIRACQFDSVNIKNLDYMIGSMLYESLDEKLKTDDHVFACLENGLNSYKLDDIKRTKEQFLKGYYKSHRAALEEKIRRHGMPY